MEEFKTRIPEVSIRAARPDEAHLVLQFIIELAEYERLAHEVQATEELIAEHLFGENPRAEVVFACHGEELVGFALFFHNFSTFQGKPGIYLEDLYVRPEMRGKGIGTALLAFLARMTVERGGGRLEWGVLTWNTPAREYYASIGAEPQDRFILNRVTGKTLEEMARKA